MKRTAYVASTALLMSLAWFGCSGDSTTEPSRLPFADRLRVPEDFLTIQEAIDSASGGAVIEVGPGIYSGAGNNDLRLQGKSIHLISVDGPANTIIECYGEPEYHRRGFYFSEGEGSATVIEGFTVRGGYQKSGAAVFCINSSPKFRNCVFVRNTATVSGGAVRCKNSSPTFINCTFVNNSAPAGGAVFCIATSSPQLVNCIVAYSRDGSAFYASDASCRPALYCTDVFGNVGGDWYSIPNLSISNGNLNEPPQFCDLDGENFGLKKGSVCHPGNNACGELIGANLPDCAK